LSFKIAMKCNAAYISEVQGYKNMSHYETNINNPLTDNTIYYTNY